ncbi:MAG: glutamine--fructose-6-phosphate transaminase (isomerizing) [Acidobacteria bacterium]|jgi:glucosamine--fructose-6-phosphate aminotransferase (isomerizing)|nr:glutamine--fructose-6-phosphate transaminase (isomerizing) [Bryobacteraceae bacterium CoA2 C42]
MCGIIGYIGKQTAVPILLGGLRRLEYRGYDSAGIAVIDDDGTLAVRRAAGKLSNLEDLVRRAPVDGRYGIGHTRWATHGRPTEGNAHPHAGPAGDVVLVHNGIVENYLGLRRELEAEGHVFVSETDTEIVAHLVEKYLRGNLEQAVREAVARLRGVFALAVLARSDPGKIVAARSGPPVVIGVGEDEFLVASDVPALLSRTRDLFFLRDGDVAVLTPEAVRIADGAGAPVSWTPTRIAWDPAMAEKGGYAHFMLKEIFEQPQAVRETFLGRVGPESGDVLLEETGLTGEQLRACRQVRIVACGTSWHAGLVGRIMIEKLARIPVEVDYGSEFRYRDPIIGEGSLVVAVSQSGETADTLAALREARRRGALTLAICNVAGSMLTREADGCLLTHAGPEIGVASTKAFSSQVTALLLLALHLGRIHGEVAEADARELVAALTQLPVLLQEALCTAGQCEELARILAPATDCLFLGRGVHFPIALEGALKLKEVSYIHAEGYPAGEMKHGPNALIDAALPVVMLAAYDPQDDASRLRYEKTLSNLQEVKARDGVVIALCNPEDEEVCRLADYTIAVPVTRELLLPLLEIVPLQLLAYYTAVARGCDVDRPRNLAKSVTVE